MSLVKEVRQSERESNAQITDISPASQVQCNSQSNQAGSNSPEVEKKNNNLEFNFLDNFITNVKIMFVDFHKILKAFNSTNKTV